MSDKMPDDHRKLDDKLTRFKDQLAADIKAHDDFLYKTHSSGKESLASRVGTLEKAFGRMEKRGAIFLTAMASAIAMVVGSGIWYLINRGG